ncbi:MAG: PEP-CTERM sorting domain-containing protein [Phycisphaerales bacterium]
MKSVITAAALAALAGGASADILSSTGAVYSEKTASQPGNVYTPQVTRDGATYVFDLSGIQSWDTLSSPNNTVVNLDLAAALGLASGTSIAFNGIAWDVTIQTIGGSWLSEAVIYFDDNVAPDLSGLFLTPGVGVTTPGTASFSSGGILKLADAGIPDIVLPNGILRMEFFESFDDVSGAADANWSGTLTLQATPAPGTLALIGLGGLAATRRRR